MGMRVVTAFVLSLVLAFASVSMAVARGQTPIGTAVTLCTAEGLVTTRLDAQGNPLPSTPHLCPDCLSVSVAFLLSAPIALPERQVQAQSVGADFSVTHWHGKAPLPGHARDPPSRTI